MNFAFHTSLVIRVNLDVYCGVVAQKKKTKKKLRGSQDYGSLLRRCPGTAAARLRHATDSVRQSNESAPGIFFLFAS